MGAVLVPPRFLAGMLTLADNYITCCVTCLFRNSPSCRRTCMEATESPPSLVLEYYDKLLRADSTNSVRLA